MPAKQTVRRSVAMTPQLHARLRQLADRQSRPVSEAALTWRLDVLLALLAHGLAALD